MAKLRLVFKRVRRSQFGTAVDFHLRSQGRHLATISRIQGSGWYFYGICDELKVNTSASFGWDGPKSWARLGDAKTACREYARKQLASKE